jgi:hypothetical protein
MIHSGQIHWDKQSKQKYDISSSGWLEQYSFGLYCLKVYVACYWFKKLLSLAYLLKFLVVKLDTDYLDGVTDNLKSK